MSAMPMIPMEPAKDTSTVLVFFVHRLLKLSASAVRKFIEALPRFLCTGLMPSSSGLYGLLSSVILPSLSLTILFAYFSASSGLCVTMTTSLSLATSLRRSMTCTDVSVSSAPVGSSASRMSGSLTSARAMATLCICPPES